MPGIFRIPGSNNVVAALYHYYCARGDEEDIAGTVRCPSLPTHIKYIVHDVASTFKRFLSGVPGGILGSLALFDALVSIQNQLRTDPDVSIRRQTLIRSRLIALAIATLKSQYRRELICAVFGLLSMIGYATETNYSAECRETLPATELMGCGQLGIVFGPLLIGDLLDNYNMRVPNPYGGLILLPITPPRSRKERQKSSKSIHNTLTLTTRLDKIKVANCLTEMLIIHWRDVVDYLKSSQALKVVRKNRSIGADASKRPLLRPSASEAFPPRVWDNGTLLATKLPHARLNFKGPVLPLDHLKTVYADVTNVQETKGLLKMFYPISHGLKFPVCLSLRRGGPRANRLSRKGFLGRSPKWPSQNR